MSLLIANYTNGINGHTDCEFLHKNSILKSRAQGYCAVFLHNIRWKHISQKQKKTKRWNMKKEIIVTFSFLLRTEIASLSLPVFICPSDKLFNRASRALTLLILNRLHFPCSVDQRRSNPSFPDVTFATVIFYTWYMLLASINFFFYEDKIFVTWSCP